MPSHRIVYVDVFTDKPLFGNPVAVVFDADHLDEATMRRVAAFTNLSETVFVLRPEPGSDADYRVRIFTPKSELPFAGHPTIGVCHAIRSADASLRKKSELVQACAAGLIPLRVEGDVTFARVPRPRIVEHEIDRAALAIALGTHDTRHHAIDAVVIDCGPRWVTAAMPSVEALYALRQDDRALVALSHALDVTGVTVYALDGATPHVRSFAPASGISEDPVCGSGNACVGAHLRTTGRSSATGIVYTARQGQAVGRDGFVRVRLEGEDVLVGGPSVTVLEGMLALS